MARKRSARKKPDRKQKAAPQRSRAAIGPRAGKVTDPALKTGWAERPVTRRWCLAGIVLIAGLVYANSLQGGFVWDDRMLILDDHAVQSLANVPEFFTQDYFFRADNDIQYGYYRPVVKALIAVDWALWGEEPFGFHLTNIVLHMISVLLMAMLLGRLRLPPGVGLVAVLLFAVHPIHTENVAWIAGRTDLLAFLLTAVSLLLLLAALPPARPGCQVTITLHIVRVLLFVAGLGVFALALLAKEMSLVLVPWLGLCLWLVDRRSLRFSVLASLPALLVFIAYYLLRFVVLQLPAPGQPAVHTVGKALLSAPVTVVHYLFWLLGLGERNAYVQNPYVESLGDWRLLAALVVLAVLVVVLGRWWQGAGGGLIPALTGMLACSFLPVLNLVRIAGPDDMGNTMAERFCYFPSFPCLALLALGGAALLGRLGQRRRPLLWLVLLAWLAYGTAATVHRNRVWRDELTFLNNAVRQNPGAGLLWTRLANFHMQNGRLSEAAVALERSRELMPASSHVLAAEIFWQVVNGRFEEAVPLQEQTVARSNRSRFVAVNNLAFLYLRTGRVDDARDLLEKLVADGKGYSDAYFNLGRIIATSEPERAQLLLLQALDEDPGNLRYTKALADLEARQGRWQEAEAAYRRALLHHPGNAGIYNNLADLAHQQGDATAALSLLERSLALDPSAVKTRRNYAKLLEMAGRQAEAITQLELALDRAHEPAEREEISAHLGRLRAGTGTE